MVSPSSIARKLKLRDKKYGLHEFDHLTATQLAQEIATENKVLEGRLAVRGLDRSQLIRIMDNAMRDYRNFVEEKYKIKLPNIGEITILPIWGKTAKYYNPDRRTLAFVIPTVPAIFLDMGVIEQQAIHLTKKPWWELSGEEFQSLMARYLNEIRPHETTHLASDLAFWYLDEENNSDKHKKVNVGKLGPMVTKPIGLDEDGDIVVKRRGRGLMEAVTVELTNKWAEKLNSPLDIDAYKRERQVLHELVNLLKKDQNISEDDAFNKFVQAYFTPDGFSHLAQELSGRKYEQSAGGSLHKTGAITRPHFLEVVYALMEHADRTGTPGLPNYSLTLSYIRDTLTPAQKQEILQLVETEEKKEQQKIISRLPLPKSTRDYLRTKLSGITPPPPPGKLPEPPPPKPPAPPLPEPPKPPAPPKEVKTADELTKETLEKLMKQEDVHAVMDEKAMATLIPTLLPSIEKMIMQKVPGMNIKLNFRALPEVKIMTPQSTAEGNLKVDIGIPLMDITAHVKLTMENKGTNTVSFTKAEVDPEEFQEAVHSELTKLTLNQILQSNLSAEVSKASQDIEVGVVELHFTQDNRLELLIKGKKKGSAGA